MSVMIHSLGLDHLNVEQRIALADELLESAARAAEEAPLTEAQMSLVGSAPSSAVAAEDVRDFKSWMGHCRRINPALSS